MIHVLDFDDNIIDYISKYDNYITQGTITRDTTEETDTFDFIVDSDRAYNLRERNRIIVQDRNNIYREYIIVNVSDDIDDQTTVQCNASYIEDLTTAKPYAPGGFTKYTTTQALDDITKDTGWETSEETEYGGVRSSSWTSYQTRYEVARQMRTTYDMVLDFSVELSSNSVAHRYVSLKEKQSLFKGKEIVYGKDLLSMTRTVDITEVHTALLAIGPEDESGNRKEVIVTDDDAQSQFGLEKRYIWGVYEPESEDSDMTEERLTTLARTQLNKDKQAAISYEITAADLSQHYSHEEINLGDTVRVKDTEFNPPLYVDAEVVSENYDIISGNSEFTFGNVNEYKESELRKDLYDRINDIQKKMNDNISNVNTIVADVVEGQLEYFERKIIKSDTAPENPVNDMLWYDTSNPEVAVLRRYWNGEWIEQTADDVEKIGGITREKALFNSLTNTFTNLSIQHAKLQSDVYEVVSSEYLVDDDLKAAVNTAYNNTTKVFDNIKGNLDSMTPETATIGKLVDTQALFLTYRERMQTLYNAIENAKRAIDKRFKLLQSQYTDEKFNTAMETVAATLPNGVWDSTNMQLISDIPNQQQLEELRTSLQAYTDGNISDLKDVLTQSIDSKINVAKDEISASVTSLQNEIDGLEIGGRNLIPAFTNSKWSHYPNAIIEDYKLTFPSEADNLSSDITIDVEKDTNYTFTFNSDLGRYYLYPIIDGEQQDYIHTITEGKDVFEFNSGNATQIKLVINSYSENFGLERNFWKLKLEKGTVATDWTPAPEDSEYKIALAQQQATDAAKAYADAQDDLKAVELQAYADGVVDAEEQRAIQDATEKLNAAKTYAETKATEAKNAAIADAENKLEPITARVTTTESNIKVLQDGLKLTATKTEVEQTLNDKLTPIQNQVNEQKATLDVLPEQIASKVSQSEYTTDQNNIVSRLNSADTERVQLANQISDKVTLKEYNDMKIGTRNLALNTLNRSETSTQHTTHARIEFPLVKPLEIGKTYTVTSEVYTSNPNHSGSISIRMYNPDNGFIDVPIVNNRIKASFVANVASTTLMIYKEIEGQSSYDLDTNFRNTMLVEGNKIGDYEQAPEDTEQTLTTMQTQINQNGTDINLKASSEEFNASRKTLSRVISDLTVNTTTGITMSYDENGSITSHTVDANGVKIRGDKVDIAVNKEFQVLAGNVDGKVGKDEVVNRLNLSPEGLDINVNKIGIRGGTTSTKYVDIRNDKIELGGNFTSVWRGTTTTDPVYTRLQNGHLRIRNDSKNASLYYTFNGISTYADGEGESGGSSGTIAWWDPSYSPSGANGITINSYGGVAALTSGLNRTMVQSRASVNLESMRSPIFLRPNKSEVGNSTFSFTTSKGETSNANVKGYLMFGDLVDDDNWKYYSGLRFYKGKPYIEVVDSNFTAGGYTVLDAGNIMTNDIFKRNGSTSVYWNGTSSGTINDGAMPVNNQLVASSMVTNRGDYNMYLGPRGNGSLLVTDEHGYNNGNGQNYSGVGAKRFTPMSSEKIKTDIEPFTRDALQLLVDEVEIMQYKYINDVETGYGILSRGLVVGDGYKTPPELVDGEGINLYEMTSWAVRAIQQLNGKIEAQNEIIKNLEAKVNE